jgi:hypothetical protein
VYLILIINPETIDTGMSAWMTYRENTCFKAGEDAVIEVDCGEEYAGLMYVLLHEGTHIVDYIHHITPYVERDMRILAGQEISETTPFVDAVWADYYTPVETYRGSLLKEVTFYGFSGGPLVARRNAADLYRELQNTPFASLYGSMNWAEDLAEYVTWYHYTRELRQPYFIHLRYGIDDVQSDLSLEPMERESVLSRHRAIDRFY